ncbi:hypothetical protein WA026_003704 [Henosepilachna vigintioctopunctata]|uniref:Uncharacterized protein n=1 Tax=Henosepilachna vigintioctopunctata TaxID=420089 RepID=A0AAW1U8K6_9CUCU
MYLVNMYKCLLVVLMFLFIHETLGEEGTMIATIIKDCTLDEILNKTELKVFRSQPHFSECQNWTSISSINSQTNLRKEGINYIRCLLYFETFISFCKQLSPGLKNYNMIFNETIPENMDVQDVCKGLLSKPKIDSYNPVIWKYTQNKTLCEYVCTEIKESNIILNSLCAKSYYYNNLTLDGRKSTSTKPTKLNEKKSTIDNILNIQKNKSTTISDTKNLMIDDVHSEPMLIPPSEKIETEDDIKPLVDDQYSATEDNMPDVNSIDSSNYLSQKITENVDEQKSKPNHNTYATSDKKQYNADSTKKTEEQVITIPREVEVKSKHEEKISNTFESSKIDQFSETYNYDGDMEGNSYFFTYFTFICVAFIIGYVGYHNKQKILALLLEGRQTRRTQREARPNSANYHKLDSTLEEAISSSCNKNSSYVIY